MKKQIVVSIICTAAVAIPSFAQLGMFTKEQRIAITREWKGERFEEELTEARKGWTMRASVEQSLSDRRGVILRLQQVAREPCQA